MTAILELRTKRAKAWDAAKNFLDSKRGNDGMMSAEDAATYDRMEADVINLGKEIERLERQAAIDNEMGKATSKPITDKPGTDAKAKTGTASDEYKSAFWQNLRSKIPEREVLNALQVGTDVEGGVLAPDEYQRTLMESLQDENIFRKLARVIHTSSGENKIPVVASKGSASWIEESAMFPESDDTFGLVAIGAYKLATMIRVSEELLNDSVFDVPAYIAKEFPPRIGAAEEQAFFTGDGKGKPTGILAEGGAEVGVTATAGNTITMDEVMDLFYSLRAPYRRNSVFIMNDSTVKALRKLKTQSGDYIWQPSVQVGEPDKLLGRPIYTSTFMPTLEAGAKSILFGDLSYYWVADRVGRKFKRLNELYAANGQVGFLGSERVDGKLILPEAVKCLQMKAAT